MNYKIICIGRQFGSGGHEIGKRLAEELGYQFYDQTLLIESIQNSSISSDILKKADEKKENAWLYQVVYDESNKELRGISANEALFRMQSRTILEAAQKENCVFVGRCADYVLEKAGLERLSLFISAPFRNRVKRKMELMGEEEKKITALVRKIDHQRKNYYNFYTQSNWGKIDNYDFCINSATLGVEQTAVILKEFINENASAYFSEMKRGKTL